MGTRIKNVIRIFKQVEGDENVKKYLIHGRRNDMQLFKEIVERQLPCLV